MGTKILTGNTNDYFEAHKEGGILGIGDYWNPWYISGNPGNDTLKGGAKNDTIHGGSGNDVLEDNYAGDRDVIVGGSGNDTLKSWAGGQDTLEGWTGDDVFYANWNDVIVENANEGYDTVYVNTPLNSFDPYTMPENVETLKVDHIYNFTSGFDAPDKIYGNSLGNFIEVKNAIYNTSSTSSTSTSAWITIYGGGGGDVIFGSNYLQNVIDGGTDDDLIFGGWRNDYIMGDDGKDTVWGAGQIYTGSAYILGRGERDTLIGGAGADTFVLGAPQTVFYDDGILNDTGFNDYGLISDFRIGEGDRIQLAGYAGGYELFESYPTDIGAADKADTFIYRFIAGGYKELIGIVQDVSGMNLNSSAFHYVG